MQTTPALTGFTPAVEPTAIYGSLEYSATVPVKEEETELQWRTQQALEYRNGFGVWRPTIDSDGQVGMQYLPEGTSFADAVTTARKMSGMATPYQSFDEHIRGSNGDGFLRFAGSGTRPVAVLQAEDGTFQLAPMGDFSNRREVSAVMPTTLEATFRYDADPNFFDRFKRTENRFADAATATVEAVRVNDALKAVVGAGSWADLREAERSGFAAFSTETA